jgi:Zn finger protein HypA/HybF involved in hydrogenase expression
MHELSMAHDILALVSAASGGRPVRRVVLVIG